MAQDLIINGVQYQDCPEIDVPIVGGGTAKFMDTSDADAVAGEILSGKKAYVNGLLVTGSISSKSATTYNPSTSNQTINASQYLSGAQTIAAVTTTNLSASNIASGVTVKVGCAADDDCVASVTGSLALPVISQDSVTKILSIS